MPKSSDTGMTPPALLKVFLLGRIEWIRVGYICSNWYMDSIYVHQELILGLFLIELFMNEFPQFFRLQFFLSADELRVRREIKTPWTHTHCSKNWIGSLPGRWQNALPIDVWKSLGKEIGRNHRWHCNFLVLSSTMTRTTMKYFSQALRPCLKEDSRLLGF